MTVTVCMTVLLFVQTCATVMSLPVREQALF